MLIRFSRASPHGPRIPFNAQPIVWSARAHTISRHLSPDGKKRSFMTATQGLSRPTGWHYHECDGQFIYILKGWVELQFEDGKTIKVEQGDSLFIPGYLRHNETRTSEEMEILEVSVPGELGTKPCEAPAGFKD